MIAIPRYASWLQQPAPQVDAPWLAPDPIQPVQPAPAESRELQLLPKPTVSSPRFSARQRPSLPSSPLLRAWSWLHTKYEQTATKRLRVVETVSLGEKRFVALVSVEGRQFLIGGGAASVSILAQLGETSDPAISLQTESLVQGASE